MAMRLFGRFQLEEDYAQFLERSGISEEEFVTARLLDRVELRKAYDRIWWEAHGSHVDAPKATLKPTWHAQSHAASSHAAGVTSRQEAVGCAEPETPAERRYDAEWPQVGDSVRIAKGSGSPAGEDMLRVSVGDVVYVSYTERDRDAELIWIFGHAVDNPLVRGWLRRTVEKIRPDCRVSSDTRIADVGQALE